MGHILVSVASQHTVFISGWRWHGGGRRSHARQHQRTDPRRTTQLAAANDERPFGVTAWTDVNAQPGQAAVQGVAAL